MIIVGTILEKSLEKEHLKSDSELKVNRMLFSTCTLTSYQVTGLNQNKKVL